MSPVSHTRFSIGAETDTDTDRQTDRQTDRHRHTDTQTDTQTHRHTDTQKERKKENSKTLFYKDCSLGPVRENSELRMFYCRKPLDPLEMV